MEYVYAALMLHKLQKEVTEENVAVTESENAKEEQKPLKILLAHAKRQYKKHFMGK